MSDLTKRLATAAMQHRGTDLGGLLQWAGLHIASQDEALAEVREQFDQLERSYKELHDGINAAADAVDAAAKSLQAARPVDITDLFARDYSGHINLMAGHGDPDYLKANGMSIRHVDLRQSNSRKTTNTKPL